MPIPFAGAQTWAGTLLIPHPRPIPPRSQLPGVPPPPLLPPPQGTQSARQAPGPGPTTPPRRDSRGCFPSLVALLEGTQRQQRPVSPAWWSRRSRHQAPPRGSRERGSARDDCRAR